MARQHHAHGHAHEAHGAHQTHGGRGNAGGKDTTVVVLGAGFAGLSALRRLRGRKGLKLILINELPFFTYTPALWEWDHFDDPEDAFCIDLRSYCHDHHIEFIEDRALRIDPVKKTVECVRQHLTYDLLLLAPGSKVNYYSIPGLQENSSVIKNVEDFHAVKTALTSLVNTFQEHRITGGDFHAEPLRVLVGGGGLTGVDAAVGAHDYLSFLLKNRITRLPVEITIVDGNRSILSVFDAKASDHVRQNLHDRGIEVIEGVRIQSVHKQPTGRSQVRLSDGTERMVDLLLWTGGVQPSSCARDSGLVITERGCIETDAHLQAKGSGIEGVFVAGDLAYVLTSDGASGKPLPMTAHWAMVEGGHAAANILRMVEGKPLKTFRPGNEAPTIVGMGGHDAVFIWRSHVFEGYLAELLRLAIRSFVLWYLK